MFNCSMVGFQFLLRFDSRGELSLYFSSTGMALCRDIFFVFFSMRVCFQFFMGLFSRDGMLWLVGMRVIG